jgi:transposase-like protein
MMSEAVKQRRAALTSRLRSFETEVLAQEENLAGLATLNRELIARAEASMPSKRLPTEREWRSAGEGATPRRHWTDAEKLAMVRECETPGSSVSVVSRRYDINSNMLFNWRNQVRRGVIGYGKSARPIPDFVPVTIIDDAAVQRPLPAPHAAHQNESRRRPRALVAASRTEAGHPGGSD